MSRNSHVCPLKPLGHLVESPKNGALLFFGYHVTDGDTVKVLRDRGGGQFDCQAVRIAGVDTPELRSTSELERQAARAVREVVDQWLYRIDPLFLRVAYFEDDKYAGRFLGDLFDVRENKGTLSTFLQNSHLARPYDGGKKQPWSDDELRAILGSAQRRSDPGVQLQKIQKLQIVADRVRLTLEQLLEEVET